MVRTVRLALVPGLQDCGAVVAANDRTVLLAVDENLPPSEIDLLARELLTDEEYNVLFRGST